MLEYIRSLIFKCVFVGANALVPNKLRIYYTLFDVHWVKTSVMEVSMSISGFCMLAADDVDVRLSCSHMHDIVQVCLHRVAI